MAIPLAVVAVAGSVYQGYQARQQAIAAEKQQKLNNQAINDSAVSQYSDLSAGEVDILESSAEEGLDQQIAALQARGRVVSLAGSSGTFGGSVDSVLSDLSRNKGRNLETINRNRDTQLSEVDLSGRQIAAHARSSKGNRTFFKPSAGLIALNAASSGAQAYTGAKSSGYSNYKVQGG